MTSTEQRQAPDGSPPRRPNIVYILADQHRHDAISGAGHPVVSTPNLDRLSKEGTRFETAWCQSPVCQSSRASIITGRHVAGHGVSRNFVVDFDPEWPTFMHRLRSAGYTAANVGKTHYFSPTRPDPDTTLDLAEAYGDFVRSFGFDHVVEEFDRYLHVSPRFSTPYTRFLADAGALEVYREAVRAVFRLTPRHWDGVVSPLPKELDLTSFLTDRAIEWIESLQGRDEPFFLQLSFVAPHVPLMGDPEWSEHYQGLPVPPRIPEAVRASTPVWAGYLDTLRKHSNSHLLDDEYVANGARQYFAMVSLIDECVGRLLDALERSGQLTDTWVLYSADHGEMLGDHQLMAKMNFYRSAVQIPAIVRSPDGAHRAVLVSSDPIESVDLTATILDIAGAPPLEPCDGRSLLGVMRGERPIRRDVVVSEISANLGGERNFVGLSDGSARATFERTTKELCEAFDLSSDPDELRNLAETPVGAEIAARLIAALDARELAL